MRRTVVVMDRRKVVVVGLGAVLLTGWGCAQVIGLPEGEWTTVCEVGSKECAGSTARVCVEGLWTEASCAGRACVEGACVGVCEPGKTQCTGQTAQTCDGVGVWSQDEPCMYLCKDGVCTGDCAPGDKHCVNNAVEECVDGLWEVTEKCTSQWCGDPPACVGICGPGKTQCKGNGKTLQECADGVFVDAEECAYVCVDGACTGECVPGDKRCSGNTPQSCSVAGQWENAAGCTPSLPYCEEGTCKPPPNCASLPNTCGPSGDESCCSVTAVPGGTYNRSNNSAYPATVSDFWLDRFEITVGRFRKFFETYPGSKPVAGAGKHPLIAQSGWDSSWNMLLPTNQAELKSAIEFPQYATWTDTAGANEQLPMNCMSWYVAFAFCAWDGGRLPTEAEWNYAAAGGNEQRAYPWSDPPGSQTIDPTYAVYDCLADGIAGCSFADIFNVGSMSPKGDGRWGQADLGGSMYEWNLDRNDTYSAMCTDCANLTSASGQVIRGGSWNFDPPYLRSWDRNNNPPGVLYGGIGARCARTPF